VLAETTSPAYVDPDVANATDYSCTVQALDAAGNTRRATLDIRTGGADTPTPSRPSGLRFTTSSPTSIELS
jgi:hypothetical protein